MLGSLEIQAIRIYFLKFQLNNISVHSRHKVCRKYEVTVSSVQSLSHLQLFATPWALAHQASLSITNSWSLLRLMSIVLVMPSDHLIFCCSLLLMPSIFPSIRVFSNESVLHIRWSKYWSFNFSISPSNVCSGLISFRMGWLDLLAVQGTLKNLLQHYSSKASILQHSAFFIVQLSRPYMTTGKTIALTRRTFVGKVMSLLFNMLSRLVIAFLPRTEHLYFMAAVAVSGRLGLMEQSDLDTTSVNLKRLIIIRTQKQVGLARML